MACGENLAGDEVRGAHAIANMGIGFPKISARLCGERDRDPGFVCQLQQGDRGWAALQAT
jgi:hypothetical protein